MEPTTTIRPLSNADREAAAALILPIQQLEFNVPITLADQPDLLDLEKAYFRPGGHFWGAFIDGELAGTIGLLALTPSFGVVSPPPTPAFGVIRKMFVKAQFRGKPWGLAQRLLETLVSYSQHNNLQNLYLGTIATCTQLTASTRGTDLKEYQSPTFPGPFP